VRRLNCREAMPSFYAPARSNVCPQRPQLITGSPSSTPGTIAVPHCGHLSPDALARLDGPAGLAANAIGVSDEVQAWRRFASRPVRCKGD
jgi:hypothetical protein